MGTRVLKDIELKIISELMRNSRRSDRKLAKSIGVSQTTVGRLIRKLERQGFIREYVMIPDFAKLGYEILAMTFARLRGSVAYDEVTNIRAVIAERARRAHYSIVMLDKGKGLGSDLAMISFHENYSSFVDFSDFLRQFDFFESVGDSFLVRLPSKGLLLPVDLSVVAGCIESELTGGLSKEDKKVKDVVREQRVYPFLLTKDRRCAT